MMVFFSLSTIIDGIFVSRYVGANTLSATNIVYTVINISIGISIMVATGLIVAVLSIIFINDINYALGDALATCVSYAKPKFNMKLILYSCMNGSNEMGTQMSGAVTTFIVSMIFINK
ncbi:hypothetical protein H8697_00155 [[Eubacterium] tenue]|nr:hypothetical protein [[Eubacterium] tenue]